MEFTTWYQEVAALFYRIHGIEAHQIGWDLRAIYEEGLSPIEVVEDYIATL